MSVVEKRSFKKLPGNSRGSLPSNALFLSLPWDNRLWSLITHPDQPNGVIYHWGQHQPQIGINR